MFELIFLQGEGMLLQGNKSMIIKTNNKMKNLSASSKYEFQPIALSMEVGQFYAGKHPKSSEAGKPPVSFWRESG